MEIPNQETLQDYVERGLISEVKHFQDENVRIYNYTQRCQFEGIWDSVTTQCRGLILNVATGEVLARPFPKFFNYSEYVGKGWPLPSGNPSVYEKLDGSLGILYKLNGKPYIATRGSFTSDQAIWATRWWRANVDKMPAKGDTHLFEIIYPENKIVVDYDFSGLVHLCTLRHGEQIPWHWEGVRTAKIHEFTDLETLAKMDLPNSEGFVVYYREDNVRMKIKFAEYIRLHKIVTGVSEIGIWEHLKEGKNFDELVDKVPDEFYKWLQSVVDGLRAKYKEIETVVLADFKEVSFNAVETEKTSRKDIALEFQKKKHPSILFALYDNKPYDQIIWKMIRPHGQRLFKVDIDA